jgi:hypothetical protein
MADQTAQALADLVSHVFPPLPCDAAARPLAAGNVGSQLVTLKRRDGDRFLATWAFAAPMPGEDVEVYLVRDEAVYGLVARVTGIDRETSRFLTVTELRRKTQRRAAPRAPIDELVLISHNGDIDAKLIDISAEGLSFLLDRTLPIAATITAVINFHGSVIPTTAQVRNITDTGQHAYRIGCAITQISDQHRTLLHGFATSNPADRRSAAKRALATFGLRHRITDAA